PLSSLIPFLPLSLFLCRTVCLLSLHSFPTRRSSDLKKRSVGSQRPDRYVACNYNRHEEKRKCDRDQQQTFRQMPEAVDNYKSRQDRKSTRLNSSHVSISYAVFCLKKKKTRTKTRSEN